MLIFWGWGVPIELWDPQNQVYDTRSLDTAPEGTAIDRTLRTPVSYIPEKGPPGPIFI